MHGCIKAQQVCCCCMLVGCSSCGRPHLSAAAWLLGVFVRLIPGFRPWLTTVKVVPRVSMHQPHNRGPEGVPLGCAISLNTLLQAVAFHLNCSSSLYVHVNSLVLLVEGVIVCLVAIHYLGGAGLSCFQQRM